MLERDTVCSGSTALASFMHGPIAGQLTTELIVLGRAVTVDVSSMDLGRFARGEARVEVLTFV